MDSVYATVLLAGLVLGVIYRTYAPYKSKQTAGSVQKFDPHYLWTAVVALVGATTTALTMFDSAAAAWARGWAFGTGYVAIFGFGFLWAIGWNYGANRVLIDGNAAKTTENGKWRK